MADQLTYKDDAAFEGVPVKDDALFKKYFGGVAHECPKCRGRGKWIYERDSYGPDKHAFVGCMDCMGWGYTATPEICAHEWDRGVNVGRCLTTYTCTVCGDKTTIDSSD